MEKDSYAPSDNDPATGATRRLTVLAYLNDWHDGYGGDLRIHSGGERPDPRRYRNVEPKAGTVVLFDSRRIWHAVAPSLHGNRWAMTLWDILDERAAIASVNAEPGRPAPQRMGATSRLRGEDPACCWLGTPCDSQEVSLLPSQRPDSFPESQRGRANGRS
eukprot:s899_g13.t1